MLPRWARVGTPVRHGRVPLAGRPASRRRKPGARRANSAGEEASPRGCRVTRKAARGWVPRKVRPEGGGDGGVTCTHATSSGDAGLPAARFVPGKESRRGQMRSKMSGVGSDAA